MLLIDYWKLILPNKSPAETLAEQWLFVLPLGNNFYARLDCVRFNRWWLFLACCMIQFCAGSIYAFTMLADTLDVYFYGSILKESSRVQLAAYICLGISAAFTGPFIERRGPRIGMFIGTVLVALGHFFSQLSVTYKAPWLLFFGYGVLNGLGFGMHLIVSISVVQKWFPDMRGFAAGLCIFFFAVGNALYITIASRLLKQSIGDIVITIKGNGITKVFWIQGFLSVSMLLICNLIVRTPPPTYLVNGKDIHGIPSNRAPDPEIVQDEYLKVGMTLVNYTVVQHEIEGSDGFYFQQVKAMTLLQCMASTDFICLYLAFAANILPILIFIPEIRQLTIGIIKVKTQNDLNQFLYTTFVGNLLGRLLSPLLSDLIISVWYANPAFARKFVFVCLLILQCVVLIMMTSSLDDPNKFKWLAAVLTSASGGGLAIVPSFVTDMFGVYHGGTMYGIIWTSWSLGAVISTYALTTTIFTRDVLCMQIEWMKIYTFVAIGLMVFVRTNSMDRFFYGYQYSAFGKVLFQIPFRMPDRETMHDIEDSEITMLTPNTTSNPEGFILWNPETEGKKYNLK